MKTRYQGAITYKSTCRECGAEFETISNNKAFCCAEHRNDFANRRVVRGIVLYDLFMATRYERAEAQEAGLWSVMCRLGEEWRQEDKEKRNGRPSWQPFRNLLEKFPYLKSVRGRI